MLPFTNMSGDSEQEYFADGITEDLTAYDAFTKGQYHFGRLRVRDMAEARRWFERAIELDPTLWNPYFARSATLLTRGRTEQALRSVEHARELAPNESRPHLRIAVLHAKADEPIPALESLQRALRLNSRTTSDAEYLGLMALIYRHAGREDEAVQIREQLRAENPDVILPRLTLAAEYQAAGRHDEANALIQEVLQVNPELTAEALKARRLFGVGDSFIPNLQAAGLP